MELHGSRSLLISVKDDAGQGLVEYGLMIVLVAVIAATALTLVGTSVSDLLNAVGGVFP